MATYIPTTSFIPNFFDDNGNLLSGGTIEAFLAGTSTPTAMFTDEEGTSAGTVITLNARGEPETSGTAHQIWIDATIKYDFILKDGSGGTINNPRNVPGIVGVALSVETLAIAKALTTLVDDQVIKTDGYSARGDGGANYYLVESNASRPTEDGGHIIHVDGSATQYLTGLFLDGDILIEQFGATSSVNANEITAASAYASSVGRALRTKLATLSISGNTDFNFCDFYGNGTIIDPNGRDLRDIGAWYGVRQADGHSNALVDRPLARPPAIEPGIDKIIYEEGGTIHVVTQGGAGNAGLIHEIDTGNVVSPSLPGSSLNTNWELYRATVCRAAFDAFIYNQNATETGTWASYTIPDSFIDASATSLHALTARHSTVTGGNIQLTATAGRSGKITVGFFGTATSPTTQAILVDGATAKTVNLQNAGVWIVEIETTPGDHTVSITHNASGTNFYVIGVNVYALRDLAKAPREATYDKAASYQKGPSYITNKGAHDYAIRDNIDDLWGGSYHGGETQRASPAWWLDGVSIDPTATDYVGLGKAFSVFQQTTITWSTQTLDVDSITAFGDSSIQMTVATSGTVRAKTFHAGMCGTSESFEGLLTDRYIADVTATTDTQQVGRVNQILQFNASVGRRITSEFTEIPFVNSPDYGGATVTYASTLYNKVYYGPARNTDQSVTDLAWTFTRTFG